MNFLLTDLSFASVGYYITFPSWNGIEKVRRYQRDNQKPSIEEQAIQWPKRHAMIKNQQPLNRKLKCVHLYEFVSRVTRQVPLVERRLLISLAKLS
jgi:hypothetical protein